MDEIINKLNNVKLIDEFTKQMKALPPIVTIRPELTDVVAEILNTTNITITQLLDPNQYFHLLVYSLVKLIPTPSELIDFKYILYPDFSRFDNLIKFIDVDVKNNFNSILEAMFNFGTIAVKPIKSLSLPEQLRIVEKLLSAGADARKVKDTLLELLAPMEQNPVRDNILYMLENPVNKANQQQRVIIGKKRSRMNGGGKKKKRLATSRGKRRKSKF